MDPTTRLKKRQSWFGDVFRTVAFQSALTAKAAVDVIRERIGPSPMPALPEPSSSISSPKKRRRSSADIFRKTLGHHRTYSAKQSLSSIRSHIPRRSIDTMRHSFSDLLNRNDSHASRTGRETRHKSSLSRMVDVASGVALPSSPIDVPECAPSLSLDLGPTELLAGMTISQDQHNNIASAEHPRDQLQARSEQPTQRKASYAADPVLMGSQSLVAEARESLYSKLTQATCPTSNDTLVVTPCQSPLPGTNLCMDFDEHDFHAATVKEPDSIELTKRHVSSSQSLDALASTPAQPTLRQFSAPPITEIEQRGAHTSSPDHVASSPLVTQQRNFMPDLRRPRSVSRGRYSGPPSPDRSVILAIRTKAMLENSSPDHYPPQDSPLRPSPVSGRSSRQSSPGRKPNTIDLTVALLRERTNDATTPLLERFARLYESSRMMDGTPTALAPTTSHERGLDVADTDSHTVATLVPENDDAGGEEDDVEDGNNAVGIALTTDWHASSQAHRPLSFPLQSYPHSEVSLPDDDIGYMAHPVSVDGLSSSPPFRSAMGATGNPTSAWTDSSSSVDHDNSIHDQLSLLIEPDSNSFIDSNEDISSLFHY